MIQYSLADIATITKGSAFQNTTLTVSSIITDSRIHVSTHDALFVAIKGKQHDSH